MKDEKRLEFTYSNIKEMTAKSLEELYFEFNSVKDWVFRPINETVELSPKRPDRARYTKDFYINNIFKLEEGKMNLNNVMKDRITYRKLIALKDSSKASSFVKGNDFYHSISKIIESNFNNLYEIEWKHVSDEEMDRINDILNDLKTLLERGVDLCNL